MNNRVCIFPVWLNYSYVDWVLWILGMWQWVTSRKIRAAFFQAHCPNSLPISTILLPPNLQPNSFSMGPVEAGHQTVSECSQQWQEDTDSSHNQVWIEFRDLLVTSPCVLASYTWLTAVPFQVSVTWVSLYHIRTELKLECWRWL